MILSEFKAWFEGYTEGLEGAPTKAQFDRIKEKVAAIDGAPITYPVYINRYWPAVQPWFGSPITAGGYISASHPLPYNGVSAVSADSKAAFGQFSYASNSAYAAKPADTETRPFDSHAAMYALGKAEAAAA